jgi:hypothetical protein
MGLSRPLMGLLYLYLYLIFQHTVDNYTTRILLIYLKLATFLAHFFKNIPSIRVQTYEISNYYVLSYNSSPMNNLRALLW